MFKILDTCLGGGYKYCRTDPVHPKANSKGLYPLHRVLMEIKLGRILEDFEEVHHIDENKNNDSVDNLEVLTKSEHTKLHHSKNLDVELQCSCGDTFTLKPHVYQQKLRRNKGGISCSRSCAAKYS